MRITPDLVAKHLKCMPWREISNRSISSTNQLLDHWLPPILPDIVKEDFFEFVVNKILGKLGWLRSSVDSSFTRFKVKFEPGGYRGLSDFIEWNDKLDDQFLEQMIPLLQSIAKCTNSQLTVEQFYMLATELCKFTNFPLTSLDISIIKTFSQMPMITIPALARLLGISYKKARSRWSRLRRLNICNIQSKINYQIVGLIPVFIELFDLNSAIRSPYLLSRIELLGNSKRVIYFMVVPEEELGTLSKFLDSHFGTTHTLYTVEDLGQTVEFTHYQTKAGNWNIDWRKLFLGAHLLHNYTECDLLSSDEVEPQPTRLYLPDEKDKKLIPVLLSDALIRLEKLAQISKMSISQASRRKTKLLELGVLRLEPLIRRVGLIEDVIIRVKEKDARILGIIDELPQAWIRQLTEYHTGNKELFLYATLPAGSFALMRYYLNKYLQTESDVSISGPENGGWPLTFEAFDTEKGNWIWQEPIIVQNPKLVAFDMETRSNPSQKQYWGSGRSTILD